jgi:cysteine desulfurase
MFYLDHNATTPTRPEALEVVQRTGRDFFGNPSSLHRFGREARALLEEGRERLGELLGVRGAELVFTSGGTEANRLAIEGALEGVKGDPCHAVVSAIEHPSVLDVYEHLGSRPGLATTRVVAGEDGRVRPGDLLSALRPETRVLSLQHANNETGVIQDVCGLAQGLLERAGDPPLLHVDAVQSFGKLTVRPRELGADLVALSSHKVGGPKGVGALWVQPGRGYASPVRGGPQERRMRPGTENLPAILGFVRAAELALEAVSVKGPAAATGLRQLLGEKVPGVRFNGGPVAVLPNTVNVSFEGVAAELLVIRLDQEGVAVSTGSACASGSREPSHVLVAMGLAAERVRSAVRFSTGWTTREAEVEAAVEVVRRVVEELRECG